MDEESIDKLKLLQYRDIVYSKIPRAMRFADSNSMAFSLELREPFLDHRIVELGLRQPVERKIKNGVGKVLPRMIADKIVPKTILETPKRSLQTPQREWLSGELVEWVDGLLKENENQLSKFFNIKEVDILWKKYRTEKPDNSFFIWQLINSALLLK